MYRSAVVFGLYLSFAIAVGAACSSGSPQVPSDDDGSYTPPGATGGVAGSGTAMMGGTGGSFSPTGGSGGSFSSGGTTGGATAAGGTTGGTVSSGGKAASGGTTATGGTSGSAGHSTGGSSTGGTTGGTSGGTTGTTGGTGGTTGGTTGTGGTMTGAAGTSGASCDTTWMVTMDGFVRMPAKGGACWSGYAFGGGDKSSTVMFAGGAAMDFSKSAGKLELSGSVGSATADNMYAGNVYFGFNVGQTAGSGTPGKVTPTGTGLTITCTGCTAPKMRAQLTDGTSTWCTDLVSGTAIAYASFKEECYNATPGAAYAKQPISSVQISIPGGAAAATFDVTLVSVTEN